MRRKLFNNWVLKLASLALAVVLWVLVVQIGDPPDTKTFNNISVRLKNTDIFEQENKVYEVLDNTDTISVTVRAPSSVISQLRASDIVAEADVKKLTDINTIAINCYVANVEGVDYVESNKEVVELSVDDKMKRWIRLEYNTVGEVAENYIVGSTTADQTLIEIVGPKKVVETISYAGIEIDVTGYTSSLSANMDLVLYDADENVVNQDNITMNVDYVHVEVEVLATKEVPIEVSYMGVPAAGYADTGKLAMSMDTVKIAGTPSALASVTKIVVPQERMNITGESSDMTDVINLKDYLPENVRFADSTYNGKITATVYIEPLVQRVLKIPLENVTVTNLPEGYTLQFAETLSEYELPVSGLAGEVDAIRPDTITGTIDIVAWMAQQGMTKLIPGAYMLPVTFVVREAEDGRVTTGEVAVWALISEEGLVGAME